VRENEATAGCSASRARSIIATCTPMFYNRGGDTRHLYSAGGRDATRRAIRHPIGHSKSNGSTRPYFRSTFMPAPPTTNDGFLSIWGHRVGTPDRCGVIVIPGGIPGVPRRIIKEHKGLRAEASGISECSLMFPGVICARTCERKRERERERERERGRGALTKGNDPLYRAYALNDALSREQSASR